MLVKDRKPENGGSEVQVNEHRRDNANLLDAPHSAMHWCHRLRVLTEHAHTLPAPCKPVIKRGHSGMSLSSLTSHSLARAGGEGAHVCSLTGLANSSLEPFLLVSHFETKPHN